MNITFVISSLQCGGAERVISNMANYWADKGHNISIIKYDNEASKPFYKLDCRINVISLDILKTSQKASNKLINNISRIITLRKNLRSSKPDVIISFMTESNILTIISNGLFSKTPVIISERTDPAECKISRIWDLLRRATYVIADSIVVQTETIKNYFGNRTRTKCVTIPNSVILPRECKDNTIFYNVIMGMGRLDSSKGFDILIKAFESLISDHEDWKLHIYGQGNLYDELQNMIHHKKLVNRVILKGVTTEPLNAMMESDIFVLSSRFEGFPNALLEAMSCGMAVISTDCNSGPRDIITNGIDGLLVEVDNIDQMAQAIRMLMDNKEKRMELGRNAVIRSREYREETIMAHWEDLIRTVINNNN